MNYPERVQALLGIQEKVAKEIVAREKKQEIVRARLLKLKPGQIILKKEYDFNIPHLGLKDDDEEKVKTVLDQMAEQRYSNKSEPYSIFSSDGEARAFVGWGYLELRWPNHYSAYIDKISFIRETASEKDSS